MSILMIGLDLDGTALDGTGRFSPAVRRALAEARNKGVHTVIATGRPVCSLPAEIYDLRGLEYVITANGARIIAIDRSRHSGETWKKAAGELTIYENLIDKDAALRTAELLRRCDANFEIMSGGQAYIGRREYEGICSGEITTRSKAYVTATRIPIDDMLSFMEERAGEIESVSINYRGAEDMARIRAELTGLEHVTVTSSFPLNNEIGGETTSKAGALAYLLDRFGIKKEELMVCGDSPNDIAMMREAGLAVAMGNATPDVKAVSDVQTLSNTEDGVAIAIEKYVLNC